MTSSWRVELGLLVALACWLATPPRLHAQRDPTTRRSQRIATNPKPAAAADSARPQVTPLTLRYRPQYLREGGNPLDTVRTDLQTFHHWDETEQVRGWVQHLGQVGKPHRHYRWGLPNEYLADLRSTYYNPWFRRPDLYLWDLSRWGPYYDSRTPFSRIDFAQARRDQQLLGLTFAVNPRPWWNVAGQYRRRSAVGAYLGAITDHYQVALGQQFHSFDGRYQGFAGFGWQQLRDQLNGGGRRDLDPQSDLAFGKGRRPPALPPARPASLERKLWTYFTLHSYRLAGSDSSRLQVRLLGWATAERYGEQYLDPTPYTLQALQNDPKTLYPFESWDVRFVNAENQLLIQPRRKAQSTRGGVGGQAIYDLNHVRLHAHAEIEPERNRFADSSFARLLLDDLWFRGWISAQSLDERWLLRLDASWGDNGFWQPQRRDRPTARWTAEHRTRLTARWQPLARPYRLVDSSAIDTVHRFFLRREPEIRRGIWRPLALELNAIRGSVNPPVALAMGVLPLLAGRTDLVNEGLNHLRASVSWTGRPRLYRGFDYRPWQVSLTGFVSELRRTWGFDARRNTLQATSETPVRWTGVSLVTRLTQGRFYWENEATFQQGSGGPPNFERYTDHLPPLHGRSALFYENKIRRTGLTLYAGLESRYFTAHAAHDFDLLTGWFVPRSNDDLPGYLSLDAVVAGRFLKNTYVFVKFIHANEGLWAFGYYTTPHHPMLERSFSFGVNWMFYD